MERLVQHDRFPNEIRVLLWVLGYSAIEQQHERNQYKAGMEQYQQTNLLVVRTLDFPEVNQKSSEEETNRVEEVIYELEHSHEKALQSLGDHFPKHRHHWVFVEVEKHQLQRLVYNHDHDGGTLEHTLRAFFDQKDQHTDQQEVGTADDLQIGSLSDLREDSVHEEQEEPEQDISNQVLGSELLCLEAQFEFQVKIEEEYKRGRGLVYQEARDQKK